MRRNLFNEEHDEFRSLVRDFIAREVVPYHDQWLEDGAVPRELYRRLGDIGVMGLSIPEEFGGGGIDDYRFNVVVHEEAARANVSRRV